MNRPFSKDDATEKSLNHSIKDGVFFAIMGGVSESYFSAYAILLKATAPQVGLLASLPPLIAAFAQMFAVWLGQKTGFRRGIIVSGALIQVGALLCVALLPIQFPDHTYPLLLACIVLYFIGPNLGAPLWGSLMGAIVPEGVRGRFFATRNRLSSIASFSSLLAAGGILQLFATYAEAYMGFLVIFGIGMFARAMSARQLSQIYDPPHTTPLTGPRDELPSLALLRDNPNFLRFSAFFAVMQFAVAISGPFVVVYLLRDLHFSYIELTANTAASVLMQFIVLNRWGRLGDLFGNRIIIRVTGFLIPMVPLLWVLSANFWYLIFVQVVSGLLWSGYSLSTSNYLFDLTPQKGRAGMMASHNLLSSVAVFLGASVGGLLSPYLPTAVSIGNFEYSWLSVFFGVFVVSAAVRFVVALAFLPHLEEVRSVRRMSYHGLVFRVTRFSPVSGVIFDVVTRVKNARGRGKSIDQDDDSQL